MNYQKIDKMKYLLLLITLLYVTSCNVDISKGCENEIYCKSPKIKTNTASNVSYGSLLRQDSVSDVIFANIDVRVFTTVDISKEYINYEIWKLDLIFQNYIKFNLDTVINIDYPYNLNEVHEDKYKERELTENAKGNMINIFVLKNDGTNFNGYASLTNFEVMESDRGRFNSMFVTDLAFSPYSYTIPHEMGHLFGLNHVWKYTDEEKAYFGLNDNLSEHNTMNYGCQTDHFTIEQLNYMIQYIWSNKSYLLK